jgi:AraC-like DNA-binding protein
MNELYNILSIFVSNGLLLALGVMLLSTATVESPLLSNYRRARRALAGAYLFFVAVNAAEYFCGDVGVSDISLIRTVTLAIATSQAFLFTFAMLALLETRFPGWRAILREAAPASVLIVAVFIVYFTCSEACFDAAFWIFAGVYALLLVRYTWLFVRNYRRFRRRMDNYFSDNEADRLKWVAWSFFSALGIGIGALLTTVFMSTVVALTFTVIFDVFYLFFAIRFINYAHRFSSIKEMMESDVPEGDASQQQSLPAAVRKSIETMLKLWTEEKHYLTQGVKIGDVSHYVGTNVKYLSLYINQKTNMSFRAWVNRLKIEEAKHLLSESPKMTVSEIAVRVGYCDKSNFIREFTKQVRCSPNVWRQKEQK